MVQVRARGPGLTLAWARGSAHSGRGRAGLGDLVLWVPSGAMGGEVRDPRGAWAGSSGGCPRGWWAGGGESGTGSQVMEAGAHTDLGRPSAGPAPRPSCRGACVTVWLREGHPSWMVSAWWGLLLLLQGKGDLGPGRGWGALAALSGSWGGTFGATALLQEEGPRRTWRGWSAVWGAWNRLLGQAGWGDPPQGAC